MKKLVHSFRSFLEYIPEFLIAAYILLSTFPLLFEPYIQVDEGYYLGAARRIIQGDLLLQGYSFDKPFLLSLLPIPGMLLFGSQPLGFRVVPFLFHLASGILFVRLLRKVGMTGLFALLLGGALYSLPIMRSHGASALCEPYLNFFSVLLMNAFVSESSTRVLSRVFFLGFFTKFSFALFFPLLFSRIRKEGLSSFLRPALPIFILAFLYMIANPIKFGSITWFNHFFADRHSDPLLSRILSRFSMVVQAFGVENFLPIAAATFWMIYRRVRFGRHAPVLGTIFLLHLFVFLFMGAAFFQRYVVQVLPLSFLLLAYLFSGQAGALLDRISLGIKFGLSAVLLLGVSRHGVESVAFAEEKNEFGRMLSVYGSEINFQGAWVQDDSLWFTAPYRNRNLVTGCTTEECAKEVRASHPLFEKGYQFRAGRIERAPLWTGDPKRLRVSEMEFKLSLSEIGIRALRELRLGKTYEVREVNILPGRTHTASTLFYPQILSIKASPRAGVSPILPDLRVSFELGIHEFHRINQDFPAPSYRLIGRVVELSVGGREMKDALMPSLFHGYVISLGQIPLEYRKNMRLQVSGLRSEEIQVRREIVQGGDQ
jgi:hypothetical protein